MAIKKKSTTPEIPALPPKLDRLLKTGFEQQFLKDRYEGLFKDTKAEVLAEIEASEEITITQGEGFKCEYGSIILSERSSYTYDKEKIAELVNSGAMTVEQLLSVVSTFKAEDFIKTVSQTVFDKVTTKSASETFTFKATSDFKAECDAKFSGSVASTVAPVEAEDLSKTFTKEVKSTKKGGPMTDAVALERAKKVAGSVTAKKASKALQSLSVDDDIDAILKGD